MDHQARRPAGRLTPLRVLRGFGALAGVPSTVSSAPKPCRRSPGRPKGRRSAPVARFPGVKAAARAA
jgi:hypothetical protein